MLGLLLAGSLACWVGSSHRGQVRRQFISGALGLESGGRPSQPSPRAFQTRAFSGIDHRGGADWARENGLGPGLPFSHHLAEIFPLSLTKTHPEFFPLVGGLRYQPSPSLQNWNPDLGRQDVALWTAKAAQRHFERSPSDVSFAIGVNDGLIFGESPETLALITPQKWFRGRPDYSNLVYTFANRVATELEKTHPDKFVGALAYYWCEQVPDFPVHRQVIPFLTADRSQGYDPATLAEDRQLKAKWAAAGPKRLGLYDYVYGAGFVVPRTHPHLLADHLREARKLGFTDYFAEVTPNWGIDGPMPWVLAQLLQDPEIPADVLLEEYYTRYFQEAASPMRRFYERCEAQWLGQGGVTYWLKHYRNQSQAVLFPSSVCRELRHELTLAAAAARSDLVRQRVDFVAQAFAVSETFVTLNETRAALSRWLRAPQPQRNPTMGFKALSDYLDARRDFVRTTQRVTRLYPSAFYPINFDDFLRDNPAFAAVLALGATPTPELDRFLSSRSETWIQEARDFLRAQGEGRVVERFNEPFEKPPLPAKMIAGLTYGIGLPEGWNCKVEPTEYQRTALLPSAAHAGKMGLRIEGTMNANLYRWFPATAGSVYLLAVQARGHVRPSNGSSLLVAWLDAQHRSVGIPQTMRLPDGDWPDWQTFGQGARAPAGAAWVGIGLHVQGQMAGEWVEFDDITLSEAVPRK